MSVVQIISWLGNSAENARILLLPNEFSQFRERLDQIGGVKFLKQSGVSKFTAYQYYHGRRNIPLLIFAKICDDLPLSKIRVKFCTNLSKPVVIPTEINSDLAYLAGAMRDGCVIQVKERIIGVTIFPGNEKWGETLSICFENNFGVKPKSYGQSLVIYSETVGKYFNSVFEMPIHSQEKWSTPNAVLEGSDEIKKNYIAGFFDAEGCCFIKGNDKRITLDQNNWIALMEIKRMLENFGIRSGGLLRDKRTRNHRITISERLSLKRFAAIIPSRHQDKKKKLVLF